MNIPWLKKQNLIDAIPLLFSISILTLLIFVLIRNSIASNDGNFIYPLDDTYIHMAIAKNLAFNGSWGINPGQFNSASSSILYSLILAVIFRFFSFNVLIPLIANYLTALILLWCIDRYAKKRDLNLINRGITLFSVVLLTPLPTLVVSGMEHTIHCLFTFIFITAFAESITEKRGNLRDNFILFILAILVVGIRYEGLFVVFVACVLFFIKRRYGLAFALGLFALFPIAVFGFISVIKGSYFVPNSVLLKSQLPTSLNYLTDFLKDILGKLSGFRDLSLAAVNRILILTPLLILIYFKKNRQKDEVYYSLMVVFFMSLIHCIFAATGWFYRYESYLVCIFVIFLLIAVLSFQLKKFMETNSIYFWSLCVFILQLFPLLLRSTAALSKTTTATTNIYQQQYQMALFLKENYKNQTVAVNDIGAISLFSELCVVDLWGLGNIEVARSRRTRQDSPEFYDSLLRKENVKVVILYDSWFNKDVYKQWKKVATWQIFNNVVCGDDTVSFYVIDDVVYLDVLNRLKQYEKNKLPGGIKVVYY